MRKPLLVTGIAVVALVGLAALTNPSAERHREQIRTVSAERSPVAGLIGLGALTAFVSTYHPLGVASYTTVNGRVVSVGAFGWVYVRSVDLGKPPV